jgi:hypothetical protein
MSMPLIGEQLRDLCRNAQYEIFFAAPFIKLGSLKKILEVIPDNITNVKIVTRWIPEEIEAGVSDLEIFEVLQKRSIDLLLHPALHAKLYRVDGTCLLGSANLTDRALGWSWQPNIELMVTVLASDENIVYLQKKLLSESIKATQTIHDQIELQVKELMNNEANKGSKFVVQEKWLPSCLKPELLYKIYNHVDTSTYVQSLVECGKQDLLSLRLPNGLDENEFKKYIASIFEQHPFIVQINMATLNRSLKTSELTALLNTYCEPDYTLQYDSSDHWSIIKAWLFYFFENKYRVKVVEEVFEQGRVL